MDQLIELFDQIIEMAKAGRDALKGAASDTGEGAPPAPADGGGESAPPAEGEPPAEDKSY